MTKARQLRELLATREPVLVIGAHNGLTAKLGEEAGFDAIWASGFEISASHAMPDANILTMAENLAIARSMNDAIKAPVIADCDNGYGNAINVMRMVEEYEKAGIAAVCIEDNVFPKRCSFYDSVKRELESVEEFAGKIRAAKETQKDRDFVVIARTEALIAGWGMEEALKRGRAYADAGADLVLIHSKAKLPDEIIEFAKQWDRETPLVSVPTTYNTISAPELAENGFKAVIFANHGLRSAIKSTQATLSKLRETQRLSTIDENIVPMKEVYRLMGVDELQANEAQYLPTTSQNVSAVIVAAGQGFKEHLMPLIADRPKSMLEVKGKTILQRQIDSLISYGVRNISVVRGYKKEMVDIADVRYFDNDDFANTTALGSFFTAEQVLKGRTLLLYGDIVFDRGILERLLRSEADITVVVDHAQSGAHGSLNGSSPSYPEMIQTQRQLKSEGLFLPDDSLNTALKAGRKLDKSHANAEFIGMALFSEEGIEQFKAAYHDAKARNAEGAFHEAETFDKASFSDMLQELIDRGIAISCLDIYKGWAEVDTFDDYRNMWVEVEN
ncbi:MAG: isocitrate lyase/phosphoenolpyruvate mutase family protein [Chloracidobacterium sp.]|nr:isocitrate lyase/phosphoenolpyruvate mutase family protein [Chloracidobacterium sp.]